MSLFGRLVFCCYLVLLCPVLAMAEQRVVLVVSSESQLENIDSLELRKIYLGFPVRRDGNAVKGLINNSDEALEHVFYQNVVAMSEKSYTHRILSLTLRQGLPRPAKFSETKSLQEALISAPYSVSYMWESDAASSPDLKILRVLWKRN